jgi:hypothetical protein
MLFEHPWVYFIFAHTCIWEKNGMTMMMIWNIKLVCGMKWEIKENKNKSKRNVGIERHILWQKHVAIVTVNTLYYIL